jgi:hypothetical protein
MAISNEAYKEAVEKYVAAKKDLSDLQLQVLAQEAVIEKERNRLIDSPSFDGLTNETKRKAYLSEGLKEVSKVKADLEVKILQVSSALDVASKWLSFFKHTFIASINSDKE